MGYRIQDLPELSSADLASNDYLAAVDSSADTLKKTAMKGIATQSELASEFDDTVNYTAGDVTAHEGKIFRFTSNHAAGAWDASDVMEITVGSQLASYRSSIVAVPAASWSSTATGGYYSITVVTPPFDTYYPPTIVCSGSTEDTIPTSAQMGAYALIQNPNGYVEQIDSTHIKFYATNKPQSDFYVKVSGYGIGVQIHPANLQKNRYEINSASWSAEPNEGGYYTYSLTTVGYDTQYPPEISCTGSTDSTNPTSAEVSAYSYICYPKGYVDQVSATSIVLYATVKPATTFYILVDGIEI